MNRATGDMYDWVTHTWNPLNGHCSHECSYCYVKNTPAGRQGYYSGQLRLNKRAMQENLGEGNTVFVCSLNDLFANDVPTDMIMSVLERCQKFSQNKYVFQTKNPSRYIELLDSLDQMLPGGTLFGVTIETTQLALNDRKTPWTEERMLAMRDLPSWAMRFVSIEPIIDFDVNEMAGWMAEIRPHFVSIGADSKNSRLLEPTADKIRDLVMRLRNHYGIEVRLKNNLCRLIPLQSLSSAGSAARTTH